MAPASRRCKDHRRDACATRAQTTDLASGQQQKTAPCGSRRGAVDGPTGHQCILGIDPGLDRTGYAVIASPAGKIVDAGVIQTVASLPLPVRLNDIHAGIEEVLSEHSPDIVVVEDLFAHYRHPRTAILMGHARGVMLQAAAHHGIEVVSVSATKIKKVLTGNGHASKSQVQRAVMATFGLSTMPEPPDLADAMAAAFYAVSIRCR